MPRQPPRPHRGMYDDRARFHCHATRLDAAAGPTFSRLDPLARRRLARPPGPARGRPARHLRARSHLPAMCHQFRRRRPPVRVARTDRPSQRHDRPCGGAAPTGCWPASPAASANTSASTRSCSECCSRPRRSLAASESSPTWSPGRSFPSVVPRRRRSMESLGGCVSVASHSVSRSRPRPSWPGWCCSAGGDPGRSSRY